MEIWSELITFFDFLTANVSFVLALFVVYILSMFVFWFESRSTYKNPNSVFDMWFFMTIIMILWGRITYIITNWSSFTEWNFFWAPYERYGDSIYIFRAMPWRLFRIWDGGFLFIPMLFVYTLGGFFYTVFVKRWGWRQMFPSVMFSSNFLLGTTLFLYGIYLDVPDITRNGVLILLFIIASQLLLNFMSFIYKQNPKAYSKVSTLFITLFMIANTAFLYFTFVSSEISMIERIHVYAYVILAVFLLLAYLLDVGNPDKRKDTTAQTLPTVNLNRSVKIKQEN